MNDDTTYRFAETSVGVSSADQCETTMTTEKKQAIAGYITKLGPELQNRYGKQTHYQPEQIQETALQQALSIDYLCWAYILFASVSDFNRIHAVAGESCDYTGMRSLVGDTFFSGNSDFDITSVVDIVSSGVVSGADVVVESTSWMAEVDWVSLFDWS